MSVQQKWILKDNKGRIQGPFTTPQVMQKIALGGFTGEEFISQYPGNDWFPISTEPQFYDKLLDVLAGKTSELEKKITHTSPDEEHINASEDSIHSSYEEVMDPTTPYEENLNPTRPFKKSDKHKAKTSVEDDFEFTKSRAERVKFTSDRKSKNDDDDVIELQDKTTIRKKAKRKASRGPFLTFALILIAATVWLFLPSSSTKQSRLRLLSPTAGAEKLSDSELNNFATRSVRNYLSDTYQGYVKAQSELVRVLETYNDSPSNWALLCLTYFELWPYSFQDSVDRQAIKMAIRNVTRLQPEGVHAATCKAVDLLVSGRTDEADSIVSTGLKSSGGDAPIALYYLKAQVMKNTPQARTAIGYTRSAQDLWKGWTAAQALEASLYDSVGDYQSAANIYQTILNKNPNHTVAAIELGDIQYRKFNKTSEALATLQIALSSKPAAPNNVLSKGYLALAEISLRDGSSSKALKNAKLAYFYNPSNRTARDLVQQIGGAKEIKKARVDIRELIAEGDYYFRQADYVTALAHYRTAYEMNKKSAVAAMKAGQSSWEMNFSENAIKWLNLATVADPKLIEAYVVLADYYAQKFNFASAAKILNKANQVSPRSFEVYSGFAQLEFRRNNYEGALSYAKRALKLFDFDVKTRVLLAKSYLMLGKYNEAHNESILAVETDMNNREAQIVFAQTLSGIEGVRSGISYLNSLIISFPVVVEYRVALADIFMQEERFTEAQATYSDAIKINSKSKKAYLGLGQANKALDQAQGALDAFLQASILDPSDVEPIFEMGILYLQIGKYRDSKKYFQKVLTINDKYPRAHYYIGQTMLLLKDYNGAIEQAKLEKRLNPNLPEPYFLAAEAYYEMRKYNLCAGEYQSARSVDGNLGALEYVRMSRCYRLGGNLEIGIQMLKQAAKIESGLPEIYKEQGAIFETQGERDSAIRSYEKYLALEPTAKDRKNILRRINNLQ